jgi:hypothetical protein
MCERRRHRPLLLTLLIGALPVTASAQVFIASRPHPAVRVAPLFVVVNVAKGNVSDTRPPTTVNVFWNIVAPPDRTAADLGRDLFLLWPGQIAGGRPDPSNDRELNAELKGLRFTVTASGELPLTARRRSDMGTAAPFVTVDRASFVTFTGAVASGRRTRGATFVRIPWGPKLASPDWLLHLELPLQNAVTPTRVSWLEEAFWDRRYLIALGFGDVGDLSLYPLYFGHRDRVVPLAPDFSFVRINFGDSRHLKVDDVTPPSVSHEPSESRDDTETVTLPLVASEGMTPQVVKVQFSYFPGRVAWRPILISVFFLVLGNVTGPLIHAVGRRVRRYLRGRVQVGPGVRGRQDERSGVLIPRNALERIRLGDATYDDVIRLCGPHAEVHEGLAAGGGRTLVYRGQRLVPHRRWSVGWLAMVRAWDVEHHEVEVALEGDRVSNVQARVRRSRLPHPDAV